MKSEDITVSVEFTRDQVRLIRGMIHTATAGNVLDIPEFTALLNTLNNAEDQATIKHAEKVSGKCHKCGKSLRSHFGYCGMDM